MEHRSIRTTLLDVDEDGSDPTHWLEPVTDEQYRAAHEAAQGGSTMTDRPKRVGAD